MIVCFIESRLACLLNRTFAYKYIDLMAVIVSKSLFASMDLSDKGASVCSDV